MTSSHFARTAYEIKSPRLIIRTAKSSDAEAYYKLLTTQENFPHEELQQNLTVERITRRIDSFTQTTAKGENAFMVVTLRDTGELIGHGGYNTFERVDLAPFLSASGATSKQAYMTDIGLVFDHEHWRQGYGREAVSALIEHARNELGCEAFRTETDSNNEPWRALMRAVGVGGCEGRGKASYDENVDVWVWKFDAAQWDASKETMKAEGTWPL